MQNSQTPTCFSPIQLPYQSQVSDSLKAFRRHLLHPWGSSCLRLFLGCEINLSFMASHRALGSFFSPLLPAARKARSNPPPGYEAVSGLAFLSWLPSDQECFISTENYQSVTFLHSHSPLSLKCSQAEDENTLEKVNKALTQNVRCMMGVGYINDYTDEFGSTSDWEKNQQVLQEQ